MYQVNYIKTVNIVLIIRLLTICLIFILCSPVLAAGQPFQGNSGIVLDSSKSRHISLRTTPPDQVSLALQSFADGKLEKLTLYVNFKFDKSNILDIYQENLKKIGAFVSGFNKNDIYFAIEGHTDWVGTDQYNIGLSMRRAHAVRQFFIHHFNLKVPFYIKYWGESRPRKSNATSAGRLENRRVELILQRKTAALASSYKTWPADSKRPVVFSPDGRYIVSVTNQANGLKQWNLRYACRQRTLHDLAARPYSIVYSPNGRLLISAGGDNNITIWDAETGVEMNRMTGHLQMITETTFAPDGRMVLSSSFDNKVIYWDSYTALPVYTFSGHKDKVLTVSLSPDGNLGASGANDGEINIWDINLKKHLKTIKAHQGPVTSVRFSPMGRYLFSASTDGIIKQWDIDDANVVKTFTRGKEEIVSIELDNKARRILVATKRKGIILWNALTGAIIKTYYKDNVELTSADLSPKANLIAATDSSNSIHIWETDTGREVNVLSEHSEKYVQGDSGPGSVYPLPSMLELTAGQKWTEPHTGMSFIWVPGGCYQMGCGYWTDTCSDHEKPVHENCVDGFWIGQYEVTQGQWTQVMATNPSRHKKGDNYPVDQISWSQTQDFICRMNTITGLNFRLPTEAEWEFACRSGGEQVKYGHPSGKTANADSSELKETVSNDLGIYNMSGGVWEWNLDLYSDVAYAAHEQLNPVFKGDKAYHYTSEKFSRVQRGGAWDIGSTPVRCAHREYDAPGLRSFFLGARLLLLPY